MVLCTEFTSAGATFAIKYIKSIKYIFIHLKTSYRKDISQRMHQKHWFDLRICLLCQLQ